MRRGYDLFLLVIIPFLAPCQTILNTDSIKKKHFYISCITDSRTNKKIDRLPVNTTTKNAVSDSLVILENAIPFFLNKYLHVDSLLIPVIIDIKQFEIKEKHINGSPGREIIILFNYQLQGENHKTDFAFFSFKRDLYKYMKTPEHYAVVFKEEVPEMLRQLNEFIEKSLNSFPYRGIAVKSKILRKPPVADTIFYDAFRKLTWNDFKGKPDNQSNALATTSSSISYYSTSYIKDGYLDVDVKLLCFFLPMQSWVKQDVDLQNGLEHEQLHFDIVFFWTQKLLDAINIYSFSTAGWQYELDKLKSKFFEKMVSMQHEYDKQSDNGRNSKKQEEWRKSVDILLLKSPL